MDNQTSIKNILIHGAGQVVNLLAPFLVALYVIPVCGVDKWGIVGVVTTVYILLGLVIEFGANLIGVKEISAYRSKIKYLKNYIGLNYKYRLICCIVLIILLVIIFSILNVDKTYYWGLTWIVAWYYNPIWIYQAQESFKKINHIIFWSKLIYVIGIYLLVQKPEDYVYVVGILGVSNSIIYAWFYYKIPKNNKLSVKRVFVFISANKAIVVSNFAITCYTQAPVIIINTLLGNTYAGIFKIIDLFLVAFRSYLGVFFNVTYPTFCGLISTRFNHAKSYLFKITIFNVVFLSVVAFLIVLSMPFLIDYFNFTHQVKQGLRLSSYLLFLPVIIALNVPFYQTLLFQNQHKKIVSTSIIALLITAILGVLLTYNYSLYGIILTLYATEIFVTTAMWINGKKNWQYEK